MILLFLASLSAWAFCDPGTCCNDDIEQDFNCNYIDVSDEFPTDLEDPICASAVDDDGNPIENTDYFYDYTSFGCLYPVYGPVYDEDGDLLSAGTVIIVDANGLPDRVVQLSCDNCPTIPNIGQEDKDCDTIGDLCDNCIDVLNPLQEDTDVDLLGDYCDNCPFAYNPSQTDSFGDARGDACDRGPLTNSEWWTTAPHVSSSSCCCSAGICTRI